MTTNNILGYEIVDLSVNKCINLICSWLDSQESPRVIICANPHSLVLAKDDPVFQQAIHAADLVTPDGSGIVLASRILGGTIRERVTGSDIFRELNARLNDLGGKSCFFLGATEETLSAIKNKMAIDYPNIHFAGSYSPSFAEEFSEEENRKIISSINSASPDILWVGMTAPKQEKWIYRHRDQLNVKCIGAIGAVFDFYSGRVKRSHPVFQKMGLEWLPRLLQEPRRLFRRNFISSPLFLWMVFRQKIRGGQDVEPQSNADR